MLKKIIWIVVIVAVIWIAVSYFYKTDSGMTGNEKSKETTGKVEESPQVNAKAPAFKLQSLKGKTFSVADAKGKPLVINFWNSWCGPCKEETPELVKLYKKYKGKFQIYGVNITSNDKKAAVKLFSEDYHMNYPILMDKSGDVADAYRVQAMPTTFFVNKNGIIVAKLVGYQGPGVMTKKVEELISNERE